MSIGKRSFASLILFVLLITLVIGCLVFQNACDRDTGSDTNLLTSDYVVVELGNIWLYDAEQLNVGIYYTIRPGPDTEYHKQYDIKIIWGEDVVGGVVTSFSSKDDEIGGFCISLLGTAAEEFIELLTETSEYQRLLRAFEDLQEEKREWHEQEEEMAYNLLWEGEAPSYEEYKEAMAQIEDMDARERQIIQELHEFPYSANLPSSFVNALELVVETK